MGFFWLAVVTKAVFSTTHKTTDVQMYYDPEASPMGDSALGAAIPEGQFTYVSNFSKEYTMTIDHVEYEKGGTLPSPGILLESDVLLKSVSFSTLTVLLYMSSWGCAYQQPDRGRP